MSPTSVRSFKWLSKCDTSAIDTGTIKQQVKNDINKLKQSGQNTINDAKKSVEDTKKAIQTTKEDIQNQVQKTKDSINELRNLKNMFKTQPKNSDSNVPSTTNSTKSETSVSDATAQ